ncbi:MAG: epoxide hydrolase [Burkholderiales bacterium]|nr:epoxide hydrolase [Burkholderiales bacterium]
MSGTITPFRIAAGDEQLADLKRRLLATRWPDKEPVADWSQGLPLAYAQALRDYWVDGYDWRAREARLNRFDQFKTTIDGVEIHFVHQRSPRADALPLVTSHGWPGSIAEFHKVIGPLADPAAHGGDAADAFHVVCPALPGYGFSGKPTVPGWNVERIARAWATLMQRLGYARYVAQGGDWGSMVTTAIGLQDAGPCLGIHLTMPVVAPDIGAMPDLTDAEKAALDGLKRYRAEGSAYARQQGTRPQTIGYGLADSPMGQAAWIIEKYQAWMDCDGHPENVLSRDELLDQVMLYWLPNSAASSARLYWESFAKPNRQPVEIATGVSLFPKEIFRASRRWAGQRFRNIVHWREFDRGGHFAALERPAELVDEIRATFRPLRKG